MKKPYSELKKYLGTTFHQDWCDDGEDWMDVTNQFMHRVDEAVRKKVIADIQQITKDFDGEEELEHFCAEECRSDIFPPGLALTYREWLGMVQEKMVAGPKGRKPAAKKAVKKAAPPKE
jgi:hypothetical protein